MPEVTSSVVVALSAARTFVSSMRTASVLVPPTSMPMRTDSPWVPRCLDGSVGRHVGLVFEPFDIGFVEHGVHGSVHSDASDQPCLAERDVGDECEDKGVDRGEPPGHVMTDECGGKPDDECRRNPGGRRRRHASSRAGFVQGRPELLDEEVLRDYDAGDRREGDAEDGQEVDEPVQYAGGG